MHSDAPSRRRPAFDLSVVPQVAWSAIVLGLFSLAVVDVQQQVALTLLVTLAAVLTAGSVIACRTGTAGVLLAVTPGAGPPVPFDSPITDIPRNPCRPRAPGRR